jgi:hypothetical protein
MLKGKQTVAYPGILFGGGGFQQIQLRTEGRENGDLGAVRGTTQFANEWNPYSN